MWHTSHGDRILEGKERRLFVHVAAHLSSEFIDAEDDEDAVSVGVDIFDRMLVEDRRLALLVVAEYLLGREDELELRAWNEAVVLAVYTFLKTLIEVEIDEVMAGLRPFKDEFPSWRELLHEAWMERCFRPEDKSLFKKGEGHLQGLDSDNMEGWDFKIELIADQILHDRDCEAEAITDLPPDESAGRKEYLGIADEYFSEVPAPLTEERRQELRAIHLKLIKECDSR